MKKFNKILSLILALAMIISMCPVLNLTAFAADEHGFSVTESVSAAAGGTFTVNVNVADASVARQFVSWLAFDSSVLTLENAEIGEVVTSAYAINKYASKTDGLNWYVSASATGGSSVAYGTGSGTVLKLTFKVADTAASGSYNIVFSGDGVTTGTYYNEAELEDTTTSGWYRIVGESTKYYYGTLTTTVNISGGETHEHNYESVVTAPTCTEGGYTTYTCECGDTYTTDETEAAGHSYVSGVCSVCGAEDPDYAAPVLTFEAGEIVDNAFDLTITYSGHGAEGYYAGFYANLGAVDGLTYGDASVYQGETNLEGTYIHQDNFFAMETSAVLAGSEDVTMVIPVTIADDAAAGDYTITLNPGTNILEGGDSGYAMYRTSDWMTMGLVYSDVGELSTTVSYEGTASDDGDTATVVEVSTWDELVAHANAATSDIVLDMTANMTATASTITNTNAVITITSTGGYSLTTNAEIDVVNAHVVLKDLSMEGSNFVFVGSNGVLDLVNVTANMGGAYVACSKVGVINVYSGSYTAVTPFRFNGYGASAQLNFCPTGDITVTGKIQMQALMTMSITEQEGYTIASFTSGLEGATLTDGSYSYTAEASTTFSNLAITVTESGGEEGGETETVTPVLTFEAGEIVDNAFDLTVTYSGHGAEGYYAGFYANLNAVDGLTYGDASVYQGETKLEGIYIHQDIPAMRRARPLPSPPRPMLTASCWVSVL